MGDLTKSLITGAGSAFICLLHFQNGLAGQPVTVAVLADGPQGPLVVPGLTQRAPPMSRAGH